MNIRIDIDGIRNSLEEHFPQWTGWIDRLEIEESVSALPVDNDGRTVYYNSRLMRYYTEETQRFYIAQQMMHLRLAHHARGIARDQMIWRQACDAVVNRMLREDGFVLPMDAVLLADPDEKSAEQVYEIMFATRQNDQNGNLQPSDDPRERKQPDRKKKAGKTSDGGMREIDDPGIAAAVSGLAELLEPSLQLDFDWFPGDTIRDGMLPYRFRAYPVAHAEIVLDTSASVDPDLLRAFVRGVKALMKEDAVIRVGCFDTRFYGFHEIKTAEDIDNLELRGAGGTNFTAAINAFSGDAENRIIFTDGYAEMPEQRCDAVWVVYGTNPIHPKGGRVIYAKPPEEKEKHEIDFLIT